MNIHPQYIEKLASEAFWRFVYKNSFIEAGSPTEINEIPQDLWSREILIQMLKDEGDVSESKRSEELINTLYYAVVETILEHSKKHKNIIGILYQEDFESCKAPDFAYAELINALQVDSAESCGYDLDLKGKYVYDGDLLLRTPLPAGILLKSEPSEKYKVYIPNSSNTLGFQKLVVLPILDLCRLPPNKYNYKYFATGVFYLPTQHGTNEKWLKLIPNAVTVFDGFTLNSSDGKSNKGNIVYKCKNKNISVVKRFLSLFSS